VPKILIPLPLFLFSLCLSDGGTGAQRANLALVYMIAKGTLPLNTPEKDGLKEYSGARNSTYKVPNTETTHRLMCKTHDVLRERVSSEVKGKMLTVTGDIWTETMAMKSYLGMTVHYLNGNRYVRSTLFRIFQRN